MEVRILKYFVTVVEEKSVSRAAQVLHMTQPTLSRQLRQMEEELGVELFHRGTKKIRLTNAGFHLYRRAGEILALVDKTAEELSMQNEPLEGKVTIGSGETAAVALLSELLAEFHKEYPLVTFDLVTGNADTILKQMDRGSIDLGLLMEPIDMEKYEFIRLPVTERWVAMMRPDDPLAEKEIVTPKDLAGGSVILPRRPTVHNEIANWFGREYENLHILCTSNLYTNTAMLVTKGLGRGVFVESCLPIEDGTRLVSKPLHPPMTSRNVLAWRRQSHFNQATETLVKFIQCFLGM